MTADLYNICRYCPLLVDCLNCEDLSQLYEMSRRVEHHVKAGQRNPLYSAQVKIELPVHIHEKHHILFIFYHISCESSSKASNKAVESLGKPPGKPVPGTNVVDILHLWIVVRCSGLLLDAFAEGWEDAVRGASAARGRCSACWVPGSGCQEGTVMFLNECTQQPRLRWPQEINGQN